MRRAIYIMPYYYEDYSDPYFVEKKRILGMIFSKPELKKIGISVLVLIVAFFFAFYGTILSKLSFFTILYLLGGVALAVFTGFLCHELGHKYTAQKFGYWSEYQWYPLGLILALITGFLGIVFAAPGAVMIAGPINREEYGKIAGSGPAVNIAIAFMFLGILFALKDNPFAPIFFLTAQINAFLAGFNLIPFPPLDGSKVVSWSIGYYIVLLVLAISAFLITYSMRSLLPF